MITFFALQPDALTRQEISAWRERCFPSLERPVGASNLHITLAYLGETADWQLEEIIDQTNFSMFPPRELAIDQFGYWPKPAVAWLGCSIIPEWLIQLEQYLSRLAGSLRLQRDRRAYQPHLTLARKISTPPLAPIEEPRFSLSFSEFVLMESCRSKNGVNYRVEERFS